MDALVSNISSLGARLSASFAMHHARCLSSVTLSYPPAKRISIYDPCGGQAYRRRAGPDVRRNRVRMSARFSAEQVCLCECFAEGTWTVHRDQSEPGQALQFWLRLLRSGP